MTREFFSDEVFIDWHDFDPAVGNGAALAALNRRAVVESTMQNADAAAERGDVAMADNFWQMGVMVDA